MNHTDLSSSAAYLDRHNFWKSVRDADPVQWNDGVGAWLVTSYEEAKTVATSVEHFGKRASQTLHPLTDTAKEILADFIAEFVGTTDSDPPSQIFFKRLVRAALSGPRALDRRPIMLEIAERLLDEMLPMGQGDVIDSYAFPLAARHTFDFVGLPTDDIVGIRDESLAQRALWFGLVPDDDQIELARMTARFWDRLKEVVDDHLDNDRSDIISDLINAELDGRRASRLELASLLRSLVLGAHGTSTGLIGNAIHAALSQGDLWALVGCDVDVARAVVSESLRRDAPTPALPYFCKKDIALGDHVVREGQLVLAVFGAANNDQRQFADPDSFDIHRVSNTRNLAFGAGTHLCPGTALGRLMGEIGLMTIARRAPHARLVDEGTTPIPSFTSNGFDHLCLRWDDR